jgi:hypothetical protein
MVFFFNFIYLIISLFIYLPVPTMTAVGVANPKAQGQATHKTLF